MDESIKMHPYLVEGGKVEIFRPTHDLKVVDCTNNETWCTFPNDLLNKLPDEQKKEMFQRIQKVIDVYVSMVTSLVETATNEA